MSELQIALALIGAFAVIGILVYNRLQERKFLRQTEEGFAKPKRDVLLENPPRHSTQNRVEPDIQEPFIRESDPIRLGDRAGQEPHFGDVEVLVEPELAEVVEPSPDEAEFKSQSAAATPVPAGHQTYAEVAAYDESIEYRTVLRKLEGMAAADFEEAIARSNGLGKPVRWLGLPLGSPSWEAVVPQSGKSYLEVQAMMQLADRDGAAQKSELAALCNLIQELAQDRGWQMRCDDPVEAAARAQSLDKFCADVDVQIGLNLVTRGSASLPLARIREQAEAAGMLLGSNGAYQLLDSRGEVIFQLGNREPQVFAPDNPNEPETRGVTLLFDVPRVPDGLKNFDQMVALGRKLAQEAGALLVDDNSRPLSDAGIEKIRAQLGEIFHRMEARGVPAGSRVALRLFS